VLEVVSGSDAYRTAEADRVSKLLAERRALAAKLKKLNADAERDFPPLFVKVENLTAELAAAGMANDRLAYAVTQQKLAAAVVERQRLGFSYTAQRDDLEHALRATAAPEIDAFIREVRTLWDLTKKLPHSLETSVAVRSPVTGKMTHRAETIPGPSALEGIVACRVAMEAAEDLKLVADQSTVPGEIIRIRNSIPQRLRDLAVTK
jgi:hypothetical protein